MASMCYVHSPYALPVLDNGVTLVPYPQGPVRNVLNTPVPVKPREKRITKQTTKPQGSGNNTKKGKRRNEICLDYLKGVCKHNRYQCKFDHQELPPSLKRERVCPVFYFTGHCKFGAKCPNVHPPKDKLRAVCAVTISGNKENVPPSPSVASSSEDYTQFPVSNSSISSPSTSDHQHSDSSGSSKFSDTTDTTKRVNALLNKLAPRNFGSIVQQLRGCLNQGMQLEGLIEVLCRRAPSDGQAQAKVLARVLAALVSESKAVESLAWKALFGCRLHMQVETGCTTKAKNVMTFLSALVSNGVFHKEHVEHLLHLLFTAIRSEAPSACSDNAVLMLCVFVEAAADDLAALLGADRVRQTAADLGQATRKHRQCTQVHVMNLNTKLQYLLAQ